MTSRFMRPIELAEKAKEESVPVSLRLKERTAAYFGFIANEYKTTQSSLINELLNSYVEQNADDRFYEFLKQQLVASYLKREVNAIANMTDEQLFSENGWLDECKAYAPPHNDVLKIFEELDNGNNEINSDGLILSEICSGVFIVPINTSNCVLYDNWAISAEDRERYGCCIPEFDYIIEVPHRKWEYLVAVIRRYNEKCRLTYGIFPTFTHAQIMGLIEVIDGCKLDNKNDFVGRLVDFLIGETKQEWAEGDAKKLESDSIAKMTGADFFTKYGVLRKTDFSFSPRGRKINQADKFNLCDLQENIDLSGSKPDIITIYKNDEEYDTVVVQTWNDAAAWVLGKIYEIQPQSLLNSEDFYSNENKLKAEHYWSSPSKLVGAPLYMEGCRNANSLMGLVKKYAKKAGLDKIEVVVGSN